MQSRVVVYSPRSRLWHLAGHSCGLLLTADALVLWLFYAPYQPRFLEVKPKRYPEDLLCERNVVSYLRCHGDFRQPPFWSLVGLGQPEPCFVVQLRLRRPIHRLHHHHFQAMVAPEVQFQRQFCVHHPAIRVLYGH